MSEPLDISRRLTDDEIRTIFTSPMVSLTETYEAIALRFEVTRARREEERLRLALETANARIAEDNAVCLCGCPAAEHEAVDEGAEQCEHEDHECLRVAPAVLEIVGRLRLALDTATRERDEAVAKLAASPNPDAGHVVAMLTGLPVVLNGVLPEGSIFMHPRTFRGLPPEYPSWLDRMRAEAKKVTSALDGDGRDGFNGDGPFEE